MALGGIQACCSFIPHPTILYTESHIFEYALKTKTKRSIRKIYLKENIK